MTVRNTRSSFDSTLLQLARKASITRVSNLTGLDVIGVPVWQAVRPMSKNLTTAQGKGVSGSSARIGAVMESFEMYCSETPPTHGLHSIQDIATELGYDYTLLPGQIALPSVSAIRPWTKAFFLDDDSPTLLPSELITLDFSRRKLSEPWLLPTSTGLASGSTAEGALLHGLYEVVERHSIAACFPKQQFAIDEAAQLDDDCRFIFARLRANLFNIELVNYTSELGICCLKACIHSKSGGIVYFGTGCDESMRLALKKALLEAIQSRLTAISGARDDVSERDFAIDTSKHSRRALPTVAMLEKPGLTGSDPTDLLKHVVRKIGALGYRAIAAELYSDGDVRVFRVVVPGLLGPK